MKFFTWFLLVSLSVTLVAFCLSQGQNMLLISVMAFSPIIIMWHPIKIDVVVKSFILFFHVLLISIAFNTSQFRWTSFIYTFLFVSSFLLLRDQIYRGTFLLNDVIRYLKYLIYAYTLALVIQQMCVLFHFPVFNQLYIYESPWKLPSLALEPSHMPRFVFYIMFAYLSLRDYSHERSGMQYSMKNDKMVWICYFWLMLTCVSTTALIFVLLIFMRGRKFRLKHMATSVSAALIAVPLLSVIMGDTEAWQRSINFINAFFSFSMDTIDSTDHSAAFRVSPFYAYLGTVDIMSKNFWLGAGIDSGKELCRAYMSYISADVTYETTTNVGGMMAFIYDYGIFFIISLGYAVYHILKSCQDKLIVSIWVATSMVESINMQMFWFSLTMLTFVTYFVKQPFIQIHPHETTNRLPRF